jgi:hypothetical protein
MTLGFFVGFSVYSTELSLLIKTEMGQLGVSICEMEFFIIFLSVLFIFLFSLMDKIKLI